MPRDFPCQHDVSDKRRAIELFIEDQKPSVVLLAPVDATAWKIIVVIVGEGSIKALKRRPNVHMAFVEGLKACNFANPAENAARSRRIAQDCDPSQ